MFTYSLQKFDSITNGINFDIINQYNNRLATIDLLKNRKISACPHCNNKIFIKHGKYNGLQRYKCLNNNCKKTFSQKTKTLFSYSKKPADLWIKYFILLNNGKNLRECSSILNINLATAFYWRHKILVTQNRNYFNILKNYVEISKIMINENLKGNRNAKYINKQKVFIACAMDSNKTLLSKVISKYTISLKAIDVNFSYNIDKNAILSAYNDRYFQAYSSKHNSFLLPIQNLNISDIIYQLNQNKLLGNNKSDLESIKNLNLSLPHTCLFIHSFSLKIRKWLIRFRGVATKYLENYLNWHIMEFKNEYKIYSLNQIDLFKELLKEFAYIRTKDFSNYNLKFKYAN